MSRSVFENAITATASQKSEIAREFELQAERRQFQSRVGALILDNKKSRGWDDKCSAASH